MGGLSAAERDAAVNERQKCFAEYYAAEPNATKAAEAAGYSGKTAYSQGQRLLKNAETAAYIRELQEKAASDRIMSINRARALLSDIADDGNVAITSRLRAVDLLLRSAGAMLSLAAPKKQPPEDAEVQSETQNNDGDGVIIMLPWNGDPDTPINAAQLADGRVVPLAGHEGDDLLIYAKLTQMEGTEDAEPDGEE